MQKPDYLYSRAPDDHVIGDMATDSEVIIYASSTCPHCADWFESEWPKFKAAEIDSGRTQFIFREYPTSPVDLALTLFFIANSVPENSFMGEILYQYQNQRALLVEYQLGQGDDVLVQLARHAGLNSPADIKKSLSRQSTQDHLDKTMNRADASHVRGTPTFVIGGEIYQGRSNSAEALIIATEVARN